MSRSPRRIAYVLTAVHEGGLERFTTELVDAMSRDEFDPHLYLLTPNNPWLDEFRRRGLKIRVYNASNAVRLGSLPSLAKASCQLARDFRRDRIELVHTCDFLPAAIGRLASVAARVPQRVHTLHSLYEWFPRWAHFYNRWLSRITQVVTAVSQSAASAAVRQEGLPESKVRVVLNGADSVRFVFSAEKRLRIREELGVGPDEILIGSVGSLTTRKGHEVLVEALARMEDFPKPWQLAIFGAAYGGPQDNRSRVEGAIAKYDLHDRIAIHPPRPDVEALLSAFDIFCMPSLVEGLSLASVEAQLCGSLSVLSDIGPFREVVTDGWNGFLFESGNPDDLARVLRRVMSSVEQHAAVRANAREDAIKRFDRFRMTSEYLDIYRNLLRMGTH